MLLGAYRDLLTTTAGAAAALTGLLFVALSVRSRSRVAGYPAVVREVRAAASLLAFTNVLSVSLFGLIPGNNTGYPAVVTALIGLLFTLAGIRSMVASTETTAAHLRAQASLIFLLLIAFGVELAAGVQLLAHPASTGGAQITCDVLASLLLVGIMRAWELVGDRDAGILASILVLVGREPPARDTSPGDGGPG